MNFLKPKLEQEPKGDPEVKKRKKNYWGRRTRKKKIEILLKIN